MKHCFRHFCLGLFGFLAIALASVSPSSASSVRSLGPDIAPILIDIGPVDFVLVETQGEAAVHPDLPSLREVAGTGSVSPVYDLSEKTNGQSIVPAARLH